MTVSPQYAKTLSELRGMTDVQLEQAHDDLLRGASETTREPVGVDYYLGVLERRRTARLTKTMVRLTWAITALTVANIAAVIYSIAR